MVCAILRLCRPQHLHHTITTPASNINTFSVLHKCLKESNRISIDVELSVQQTIMKYSIPWILTGDGVDWCTDVGCVCVCECAKCQLNCYANSASSFTVSTVNQLTFHPFQKQSRTTNGKEIKTILIEWTTSTVRSKFIYIIFRM